MLKQKKILQAFGISSTLLLASTLGNAATDGTLGAASTGIFQVQFIKESSVQVSGLNDADFGSAGFLAADISQNHGFCVFSSTGTFRLTTTGGSVKYIF